MSTEPPNDADLRARLSPLQYQVTQKKGTEPAFSGAYAYNKEKGVYNCVCCGQELFSSDTKYDSGSGWPSFWVPLAADRVRTHVDASHGMSRTEVNCAGCGAHLGHVFEDGPDPSGLRYCINSASLNFAGKKP
jgi:peptide-methionine (R)-S-oxide reductase